MAVARDRGLDFAWRVTMYFQVMLGGSQQHHAAHFRQPQRGAHVQCGENALDRHGIRRELFDQPAEQRMYILKRGARALFAPLCGDRQCTKMQHPAVSPVALDDAITRRSHRGRVHTEHAHSNDLCSAGWSYSAHRTKSTAFRASLPALCAADGSRNSANQKKRPVRDANWPRKNLQFNLVRSHSRLNLRFVNVEVRVDMLHIIVFFESFYQPHHLGGLRARQLDVVLRDHGDLR
jgi:hypothetical protein